MKRLMILAAFAPVLDGDAAMASPPDRVLDRTGLLLMSAAAVVVLALAVALRPLGV
jgi:hypothetical protein